MGVTPAELYGATSFMVWQYFDGATLPLNGDGDGYPSQYGGSGAASVSLDSVDSVSGKSVKFVVTSGGLNAEFNPYNYAGNPSYPDERSFARNYSANPAGWQFNTYNRLSFWIQLPTTATGVDPGGNFYDFQVGLYVKQITNSDPGSDEIGGDHYYHLVGVPNFGGGRWTQVILNMHPDHFRSANEDPGFVPYPTAVGGINGGDDPPGTYNYFDTLTRFYLDDTPSPRTGTYRIDQFTFYKEPYAENDVQVFGLTATYVSTTNRVLVTWKRDWVSDTVNYEVRYAFSNIHALGWSAATPAPGGTISSPSTGAYNGMIYDTTALPLAGQSVVYIAIKPQNAPTLFSQIAVPLSFASGPAPASFSLVKTLANVSLASTFTRTLAGASSFALPATLATFASVSAFTTATPPPAASHFTVAPMAANAALASSFAVVNPLPATASFALVMSPAGLSAVTTFAATTPTPTPTPTPTSTGVMALGVGSGYWILGVG